MWRWLRNGPCGLGSNDPRGSDCAAWKGGAPRAYIRSQASEGWTPLPDVYSDGGFTGGNIERPGVQRLLAAVKRGEVDCIVVYKVDRLSRSLLDFARIMEILERHNCSFVSVTQQFNTTNSMGRLTQFSATTSARTRSSS